MKKSIAIVMGALLAVVLAGCSRSEVTVGQAAQAMREGGFTVEETQTSAAGVQGETGARIQFSVYESADAALEAAKAERRDIEAEKADHAASSVSNQGINFVKYGQSVQGHYRYVCQVGSTVITADAPQDAADAVKAVAKALGY
ncbi:MAG: fimbrillin family protein [Eubacteriales bacterium]|nr:fimbrillin family protein [Eubacteriales bacterium]